MYNAGLFTWIGDKGNELIARDEKGNKTVIGVYDTYSEADDKLKAIAKAFIGLLKEAKEEFEDDAYEYVATYLENRFGVWENTEEVNHG